MKKAIREKLLFKARHGARESRLKAIQEARFAFTQSLQQLEAALQQQCVDFTRHYEASTSQAAGTWLRPVGIPSELRDARVFDLMAWALCLVELGLALFLSFLFGINALFVVMLTLVGIFMLQATLLLVWRAPECPQETRLRLKRYVVIPCLVITLLSLLILIFSRGPLALLLLPLITWALGCLSVGCFGLSAGLGAFAYSLNWSKHAANRFNATAQEASHMRQALDLINTLEREIKLPPSNGQPSVRETAMIVPLAETNRHASQKMSTHILNSLLALVVVTSLVGFTGCQSSSTANLTSKVGMPPVTSSQAVAPQLAIYVDWSLSGQDQALRQASQNVVQALPDIAEKYNIPRVTVAQFGADGWDAEPITALSLPILQLATTDETEALLGNVRTHHELQAHTAYQDELRKKLAALTPEILWPANVLEPKCTDIQGVLRRIAKEQSKQISILITDGVENCASALQRVELAQPLVIVLLSEKDTTQNLSHELYEQRRQALATAVPRAVIVPHFETALPQAIQQALVNVQPKQN